VERNLLKINKKPSTVFEKRRKIFFYKLKKLKKEKSKIKNYFREIRAKKVRSKMDQQQNGQRQKGLQQNWLRQSGHAKKTCFLYTRL